MSACTEVPGFGVRPTELRAARPKFIEGVDRPVPLLYLANGGEENAKLMLGKKM